jgi:hypothetical protein
LCRAADKVALISLKPDTLEIFLIVVIDPPSELEDSFVCPESELFAATFDAHNVASSGFT